MIAVVGGGPAGLMAAEVLATSGAAVTVFDRAPSVGRKFLLAGRGGLNLTHTESMTEFLDRYGPARARLTGAIEAFGPAELRAWSAGLGQETFVGSSGRVFPSGFRATPLLRAWLARLGELGVDIQVRTAWTGWTDDAALTFRHETTGEIRVVRPEVTVLAMGGASWPRTGSDGGWVEALTAAHIDVAPLRPANCGFVVDWSVSFGRRFGGVPLKNIAATVGAVTVRGEAMITSTGIEGGAIYGIASPLRDAIDAGRDADADGAGAALTVDLQPDLTEVALARRMSARRSSDSVSTRLRRGAGLSAVAAALLAEVSNGPLSNDSERLAKMIKAVPIPVSAAQSIDRAISTAGGVMFDQVNDDFMLTDRPGTFVAGEMLDWEATTGGYLLQATFSTAVAAAQGALAFSATNRSSTTTPPPP